MKLLYDSSQIQKEVERVGQQISTDYKGKNPLLVGVLKGCTVFMTHLMHTITVDLEIDFMTVSSYKHGTESAELKLVQDLDVTIQGRDILIVEDIIDTGKTLAFVYGYLKARGAASVEVVALVNKPTRRTHEVPPAKYICFEYDQEPFLIGFGFDFKERYRNLPAVYMMGEGDY